jgi:hypothetical protein
MGLAWAAWGRMGMNLQDPCGALRSAGCAPFRLPRSAPGERGGERGVGTGPAAPAASGRTPGFLE